MTVPQPTVPDADVTITQDLEETVAIESGEKENPVEAVETPKQPTPEEIRAEQERQAAEQARSLVDDAFGRSSFLQSDTPTGNNSDVQSTSGSIEGNATQGKPTDEVSYGTWDLGGRNLVGELPRPAYIGIQENTDYKPIEDR